MLKHSAAFALQPGALQQLHREHLSRSSRPFAREDEIPVTRNNASRKLLATHL